MYERKTVDIVTEIFIKQHLISIWNLVDGCTVIYDKPDRQEKKLR